MRILKPTQFVGYMEKGASTKPWQVLLLDEDLHQRPYVVKLFTERQIEQQHATSKEIICNVIAEQMGLNVPSMALTYFDKPFVDTLPDEQRKVLATKHQGFVFASRLQDGMSIYTPAFHRQFLRIEDFANIFGFDCLIYNLDRGKSVNKPNLLVEDDNYLLIDHEQTFPFIDNIDNHFNMILSKLDDGVIDYRYQSHIFFQTLKSLRQRDKFTIFHEFGTLLEQVDINTVEECFEKLNSLNISTGSYPRIIEYLYKLKKDVNLFCTSLQTCIL